MTILFNWKYILNLLSDLLLSTALSSVLVLLITLMPVLCVLVWVFVLCTQVWVSVIVNVHILLCGTVMVARQKHVPVDREINKVGTNQQLVMEKKEKNSKQLWLCSYIKASKLWSLFSEGVITRVFMITGQCISTDNLLGHDLLSVPYVCNKTCKHQHIPWTHIDVATESNKEW